MANIGSIRNIAIVAHGGAGKTSLCEAMLFDADAITRLGTVAEGTTTMDFEPEEIDRKMSIASSLAYLQWKGMRVNIIDTPGFINFLEESRASMRAADGAIVVLSATEGMRGETEKVWRFATEFGMPRLVFVNKMDRDAADFKAALQMLEKFSGMDAIPLSIPIGSGEALKGVVDLLTMKAWTDGAKPAEGDIPPDAADAAEEYRKRLIEKVAELDDALLERYLEGGELSPEEITAGIRKGSLEGKFIPVAAGSAIRNVGIQQLLDAALLCLPSPADAAAARPITGINPKDGSTVQRSPDENQPLSAYVFKTVADPFAGRLSMFRVYSGSVKADSTVYNSSVDGKERVGQIFYMMGKKQISAQKVGPGGIGVVAKLKETRTGDTLSDEAQKIVFDKVRLAEPMISYAVEPKSKGDEDKVSSGLQRILDEDPTLRFHRDEEAKEILLSGMGQVHIEVTLEKLKRKFGVEVVMKTPKIPYRETITASAQAQGKYKKQTGGRGQYGDCWIEIEPLPRGTGFEYVNNIVGGSIPRSYIPAVEKGIVEAMRQGIVAGYQMIDVRVKLFDGSYHAVDSSEMAFKIAGSMAIKKAVSEARPVILEPIMKVEINIPDDSLGSVIGDLNSRRGKVHGMEPKDGAQAVGALIPMAEMLTYANQLHSLTAGRGMYTMEFSHYEELPSHLMQKLVEERQKKEAEK